MKTWLVQHIESHSVCDGKSLANVNVMLFIDQFSNGNYFVAALHEGAIAGVVQDEDDLNDDDNSNTDEDP